MREKDKRKPDYRKFMKRPAPLVLGPPSAEVSSRLRNPAGEARSVDPNEENIPWAEIIFESQSSPPRGFHPHEAAALAEHELFWSSEAPPVALLGLAALGLVLLLYFSF